MLAINSTRDRVPITAMLLAMGKLSDPQKVFLVRYLVQGSKTGRYDATVAARFAYPKCKTPAVLACQILNRRRIRKILALHFGFSDTEMLLADVRALIKRSRRKGANLDVLVAPWIRAAKALEVLAAKERSDVKPV